MFLTVPSNKYLRYIRLPITIQLIVPGNLRYSNYLNAKFY